MNQLTDVVKNLLIINAIVFFALITLSDKLPLLEHFVLFPRGNGFQPYQIVTSMFSHIEIRHFIFNMLALYFIGPIVEYTLGAKRFLFLYLSAGLLSGLAIFFLSKSPALGASGAINGIVMAFALMYPNKKLMIFPIPIEIPAIVLVSLYFIYDILGAMEVFQRGIAHWGHLGGAVMGIILIYKWGLSALGK